MKFVSRLITFQISHYCEKVRWALDRIGFPYIEECHLPPLHRLKTTPLGGSSVPVLVTEAEVFKDSADILNHLDTLAPSHLKLYPDSPVLLHEVKELESQFNRKLGVSTRQWGYFYALQNQSVMQQLWCEGVPKWEKVLFPVLFPLTTPPRSFDRPLHRLFMTRSLESTLQNLSDIGKSCLNCFWISNRLLPTLPLS